MIKIQKEERKKKFLATCISEFNLKRRQEDLAYGSPAVFLRLSLRPASTGSPQVPNNPDEIRQSSPPGRRVWKWSCWHRFRVQGTLVKPRQRCPAAGTLAMILPSPREKAERYSCSCNQ